MEEEVWKDIKDYEGLYQVSNLGRVKSLRNNIIRKQHKGKTGYMYVDLWINGKEKNCTVHRLVAQAFIPNPKNKEQVNHKDENKINNCVSNLEWNNRRENMNYGTRIERQKNNTDYNLNQRKEIAIQNGKKACKPIIQIKDNKIIKQFESGKQASKETGVRASKISDALRGRIKTAGGYIWKYKEREAI